MAAHKKWTDDIIAEVERLSFTMTRKEIAEKLGYTTNQIYSIIKRLKLEGRWRGGGGYTTISNANKRVVFKGCDKDCERCPYPDCLIPDCQAPIGLDIDEILKR